MGDRFHKKLHADNASSLFRYFRVSDGKSRSAHPAGSTGDRYSSTLLSVSGPMSSAPSPCRSAAAASFRFFSVLLVAIGDAVTFDQTHRHAANSCRVTTFDPRRRSATLRCCGFARDCAAMTKVTALKLHRRSRVLDVSFADGLKAQLPCEYLRVFSPSAEVRGHGGGEPKLVPGKRNVNISRIEPVGAYAVRLVFDDGHDSGLYSWEVLRQLAEEQDSNWKHYLARMADHGMSRDQDVMSLSALGPKKWTPPKA